MAAYATIQQVEAGFRDICISEEMKCRALLEEAAIIIDSAAPNASAEAKQVVSCRMVRRKMAAEDQTTPMGATQGAIAALGYSQSWTISGGSVGELYLSKAEKTMLGIGNKVGASNPFTSGGDND